MGQVFAASKTWASYGEARKSLGLTEKGMQSWAASGFLPVRLSVDGKRAVRWRDVEQVRYILNDPGFVGLAKLRKLYPHKRDDQLRYAMRQVMPRCTVRGYRYHLDDLEPWLGKPQGEL